MPLAGAFIKSKRSSLFEKIYPLTLSYCTNCKTGQIKEIVTPDKLFTDINSSGIKNILEIIYYKIYNNE